MNDARARALTERLTTAERERSWPYVRPRDAATLILIDRSTATPRVLMGRRHAGHVFMAGKFVFPGGRIDDRDRRVVVSSELAPRIEAALTARVVRPSRSRARALAATAIRETFEETGLLLGRTGTAPGRQPPGDAWAAFGAHGIVPDLSQLSFVGRAITPTRRPRRFDTRFFAADRTAVAAEVPGMVGPDSELVELAWVEIAATRDMDLPTITRVILEELEDRSARGFGHDLPVPFFYERRGSFVRELL